MRYLIYFSIITVFFSCKEGKVGGELKQLEDLTFDSGFNSEKGQIEKFNNQEYYCVADYSKHKQISLHEIDSDLMVSVPLDSVVQLGEKIIAYEVINLDTIMILTKFNSHLYFINQTGAIWKTIDFSPYFKKGSEYELIRSSTAFHVSNGKLIFSLGYSPNNIDSSLFTNITDAEAWTVYHKFSRAAPSFLLVEDVFADSLEVSFELPHFLNRYVADNEMSESDRLFNFYGNFATFISPFTDTAYIINTETFEIDDWVKVASDNTQTSTIPITTQEHVDDGYALYMVYFIGGRIVSFQYDKYRDLFYCIVKHAQKESAEPWSIIVYNADLECLDEFIMDDTKYAPRLFITEAGLLISRLNESDADNFQKNTFTLFNYE
ncbi:MAG: hypothetical protein GQ574_21555 [Crocinitomix sp.]|nr:hypothetical protein [Crocinitomix sp.]